MVSFKSTRRKLYCTPLDVRMASRLLKKKDQKTSDYGYGNADPIIGEVITDQEIEHYILQTDGLIRARLGSIYAEASFLLQSPIFGMPVASVGNQVSTEQLRLLGIAIAQAAVTEQWEILFSEQQPDNTVDFKLYGSFSGYQGTGALDADFASTDGDILIGMDNWYRNPSDAMFAIGDKLYFSTYDVIPTISYISSRITCADILRALLSDQAPNTMGSVDSIDKEAKLLLDKLAKGEIELTLAFREIPPDSHGYELSDCGQLMSRRMNIAGSEGGNVSGAFSS